MKTQVLVGLGNPGQEYDSSPHNIGFAAVDKCCEIWQQDESSEPWRLDRQAQFKKIQLFDRRVILLKPQTYMNESGRSVAQWLSFLKIPLDQILVIYDDLDLPLGRIKLARQGSAGGHNGIKSILSHLSGQDFARLKIGIGRPAKKSQVTRYVLSPFKKDQLDQVNAVLEQSVAAIEAFVEKGLDSAMEIYNKKNLIE